MKTSFKKNQLIITALAVMIAIAGYLKYSDSMIDSEQLTATSAPVDELLVTDEIEMDISAEDIYANVWNEQTVVGDNTIAVHVRHIREKIEINPKDPKYLKVVWGIGYKID